MRELDKHGAFVEPKPPKPGFSRGDSAGTRRRKMRRLDEDELGDLVTMMESEYLRGYIVQAE